MASLKRQDESRHVALSWRCMSGALLLPFMRMATLAFFHAQRSDYTNSIITSVAMALLGMILVEQLYRNTPVKQRWGIKFACLGIGGVFAYDFYLYSDALLLRHVNPEIWAARGIVNAFVVPLDRRVGRAKSPMVSRNYGISSHSLLFRGIVWRRRVFTGYGRCRLLPPFFRGQLGHGHAGEFPLRRGRPADGRAVLRYVAFMAQSLHQQALL